MPESFIEVRSMGEAARDGLSPGARVEVLASVSQALYVRTEANELFWITGEGSPMHRRGLKVLSGLPHLQAGSCGEVQDLTLRFDSSVILDLSHAPVWKAPTLPCENVVSKVRLPGILVRMIRFISDWPKPTGFGNLIPAIWQTLQGQEADPKGLLESPILETVWPDVDGMIRASRRQNHGLVLEHARKLVGLGEGLTPSGDDFLGGFFFSKHMIRNVYPDSRDAIDWNYSDFLWECQPQTNPISFAFLKDHADGHAMECLHFIAQAVLLGEPVEQLLPHAVELVGVGHSTGWDILTGFLAGMSGMCDDPISAL